jgi:hypothetical protein
MDLIKQMLNISPNDRITVEKAISHDFFVNPYDLSDSEAECNLHELMLTFNSY